MRRHEQAIESGFDQLEVRDGAAFAILQAIDGRRIGYLLLEPPPASLAEALTRANAARKRFDQLCAFARKATEQRTS